MVLPGMGKDKPPLPITELLTNSHTVPSISHWLMEFNRKLTHTTKIKIAQIETDYSWALINSVLLAFNKEDISQYLHRAFEIVHEHKVVMKNFTVLHLCSAHIMKAVTQAFGKKTRDRGLKEYASYCFASLLNCNNLQLAMEVFYNMCVLFDAKHCNPLVQTSQAYLNSCISNNKSEKDEDGQHTAEAQHSKSDKSNSIIANSPFTKTFQVLRDQAQVDILSEESEITENHYCCPGIVDVLVKNCMGIIPLWSGMLLGDLTRYKTPTSAATNKTSKSRETNCHVELWFGLVKKNILAKKKYLRPADFITKLYTSLQGRYVEHVMQHGLPDKLLDKTVRVLTKPADDPKEKWNKRESSAGQTKTKSKYFNPPKTLPNPRTSKGTNKQITKADDDDNNKESQLTLLWKKSDTEVVVAVVPSQIKGRSIVIHHSDLCTLRPYQWLTGEIIESLLHVAAHALGVMDTFYILNHYSAGVILFGDRTELPRQSLPKVNFDNYEAVLSFVLVNNNHWKLLRILQNEKDMPWKNRLGWDPMERGDNAPPYSTRRKQLWSYCSQSKLTSSCFLLYKCGHCVIIIEKSCLSSNTVSMVS
ncbi:uncharacterized protein LOC114154119 isoform X2 [Xiphophorus couchianus]|uniref:uncharacterized protein LOC114154119 isoform X2 n=1 Tax=Xiphophorus couchianus TaxID=32473 RepID=UPI001016DC6C|nr:uncharacterized protein LOC114154119 isoform X2 [Xiphophorus couchianus]